jgi:hypothetical protein
MCPSNCSVSWFNVIEYVLRHVLAVRLAKKKLNNAKDLKKRATTSCLLHGRHVTILLCSVIYCRYVDQSQRALTTERS